MTDGNPPQHLPVEERAERAHPGVVAERGERLADQHHVGFGDTDVQGAALIDRAHAALESARRRQIRVDRHHLAVAREDLHGGRDDIGRAVLPFRIDDGQGGGIVLDALLARDPRAE